MDEQQAHKLFQHFSEVHAAAKSGRGLGFTAVGGPLGAIRAVDNSERWQPRAQDDVLNLDSSRAGMSKRADNDHRLAGKHAQHDEHARRADAGRSDDRQDRHYSSRDADRRRDDRSSRHRSEGRSSRAEDKHRSSRHDYRDHNSRHREHEPRVRHDREERRDRSILRDHRPKEDAGREDRSREEGSREERSREARSREDRSRGDRSRDHRSSGKGHSSKSGPSSHAKESKIDFERAIPGYAEMTPAERMKARTKLLLDKSAKQDDRDAKGGQWTRYVFNQDALLEEEGATPADGFSGDANAVSLRLPQAKAETKQRMQTAEEAHEAAIFGKASSTVTPQLTPQLGILPGMQGGLGLGVSAVTSIPEAGDLDIESLGTEAMKPCKLAAESVVNTQPGLSWRERAALKRKQLAG